jgi:hypothetical protein
MRKPAALCAAFVILTSALALADKDKDKKYSIADLKALVEQKSYSEAVDHLADISPSERKGEWLEIASQATIGLVGTGKDALTKLAYVVGVDDKFPTLLKNAKYAALRAEVAPKGFEACFANEYSLDECMAQATKFIDVDPSNGKVALAIAKIARKSMNSYNSIPLFKRAVTAYKGGVACKDADTLEATRSSFGLPTDYDHAKGGREIAETCWTEMRKPIVNELVKGDTGYLKANACEVMKAKADRDLGKLCVEDK